ncbi:MAG: LPS assembly lipoprotein LptE [Methylophilaceae bacterium]
MQNAGSNSMYRLGVLLAFLLAFAVSACGFQLRGIADLPFKSIYIQGANLSLKKDLIHQLKINNIKVLDSVEDAEFILELVNETSEKRILSLSGGGLVREFELNYKASFRTRAAGNPLWSQVQTVQTRRDFSYNDNLLLGKAEEEAGLNLDMRKDVTREIMRRLTAAQVVSQ